MPSSLVVGQLTASLCLAKFMTNASRERPRMGCRDATGTALNGRWSERRNHRPSRPWPPEGACCTCLLRDVSEPMICHAVTRQTIERVVLFDCSRLEQFAQVSGVDRIAEEREAVVWIDVESFLHGA
jgi:hypothetical protein